MLKRKTYIAVIVFLIALAGASWAIWTIGRYMLYNPIEPVRIADLPQEALNSPSYDFAKIGFPNITGEKKAVKVQVPSGIPWPPSKDVIFPFLIEKEETYALKARTHSAFDPVKDEQLRNMLSELLKIRKEDEAARLELAGAIYNELRGTVGDSIFRAVLYEMLMRNTLRSSLENPELYPLRLAEVKSDFYNNKLDEAVIVLSRYDAAFEKAIEERLNALRNKQKEEDGSRILLIRDYLLAKTSGIESDVRNGNRAGNGDNE